ncbi:hypothetical protein H8E77_25945 [bacterium]|nr:hypothetical protein [bacterium]
MISFKRTTSGKIAKYLFYDKPLIWVEGDTDIPFYEQILRNYSHRLEAADGKAECLKLAEALIEKDHPYVVILDGDYD